MNRSLRPLALTVALLAGAAFAQADPVGTWQGAIELPGAQLDIRATFTLEGAALAGTLDIPAQGLIAFALDPVALDGDALRFGMPGVPGDPLFEGTIAGDAVEGTFTQGDQAFPFALERTEADQPAPAGAACRPSRTSRKRSPSRAAT